MDNGSNHNKHLVQLMDWVSGRLELKDVPRLQDVYEYAQSNKYGLSKKQIAKALRMHEVYRINMPQQRMRSRSQHYRPILTNYLGQMHADLGYFSVTRDYETPKSFRHGFLVVKDILSRFMYVVILRHGKSAEAMVRAFEDVLRQHAFVHPDYPISSISFDRETSVLSNKVQSFFSHHGIAFHAFQMTSSKAKVAESSIKQIRTVMARLLRDSYPQGRWWNLLQSCANILNARPIVIDGKNTGFSPRDINSGNVEQFLARVVKAAPAFHFGQFEVSPTLVEFKFDVGTKVRAKLIVTSSDLIGKKRSQMNVTDEVYVIEKRIPFITRKMTLGKMYTCRDVETNKMETFDETDLVQTP